MLREIGSPRDEGGRGVRRWFQSDAFDLFLWQDAAGEPVAMHFCYDRRASERVLCWDARSGFSHHGVDAGEFLPGSNMSPLLVPAGSMPWFTVYHRFLAEDGGFNPRLRAFVLARLFEYRTELYGRPRRPRRRRSRPAPAGIACD